MTRPAFDVPPPFLADDKEHRRQLAQSAIRSASGKLNVVLDVTLTANAATTTVTDPRIGFWSWVGLMPLTAHASAEVGAGTIYIPTATMVSGEAGESGSLVIQHANNAQADRDFRLAIFG